jgi:uncharacterized protein (DUF1330 family)
MRETAKVTLALLAGIGIGAVMISAGTAQTAAKQAYIVAEMHVTDPAGFTEYMRGEPATLTSYHGRVVARALPDMREGTPADGMVTIYAFASAEAANRWYRSPEYAKLLPLRQHSATSRVYFLDGVVQ